MRDTSDHSFRQFPLRVPLFLTPEIHLVQIFPVVSLNVLLEFVFRSYQKGFRVGQSLFCLDVDRRFLFDGIFALQNDIRV